MTSYDYKITSWNSLQHFPNTLSLFGLSGDNRVHFYIMPVTWHSPFRLHSDFTLQLQNFSSLPSLLKNVLM